jgi:LuxR family transcriptional regulator, maltose regulon positive regulatory protein
LAELRFAYDEAHELPPRLQTAQIHRLIDRTEGWPVALQLARLWLDAKPERLALLDAFSGRTTEVAEYLTEQVLSDLSSDLQRIVFDIAVLDALNPDLVTAVPGSQQTWARLIEDGRLP